MVRRLDSESDHKSGIDCEIFVNPWTCDIIFCTDRNVRERKGNVRVLALTGDLEMDCVRCAGRLLGFESGRPVIAEKCWIRRFSGGDGRFLRTAIGDDGWI